MKKQQGFTLIELLIVVAIIAIIAAIAVPNLLNARKAANESSAQGALRTIGAAQVSYSAEYNKYADDLNTLYMKGMIDERLNGGTINGYDISEPATTLSIDGRPVATFEGKMYRAVVPGGSTSIGRYDYQMGGDMVVRYLLCHDAADPGPCVINNPVGGSGKAAAGGGS